MNKQGNGRGAFHSDSMSNEKSQLEELIEEKATALPVTETLKEITSAENNGSSLLHLPVLYQDEYIIAIDKPPGLLVHRSPIDRHEKVFAVQTLRDQIGQHVYPAHRLDRPTSGVLVFSFSSEIAAKLARKWWARRGLKR